MSALADFSHKFGPDTRELIIGQSFFKDADSVFHTIRYDFVPASVDPNKTSAVDFGENGKVTVTMPNLEGSGTTESVYQGQRKPHQKECVLIYNQDTGEVILERLNQSMIVKKARLRQEDLTGKSLALNNKHHSSSGLANGNGISHSSGGHMSSLSQSKSSINSTDKKKSTVAAKYQKQSPPLLSTVTPPSGRTAGFQSKVTTPSPPSMPIFSANKGSLLHTTTNGTSTNKSPDNVPLDWATLTKSSGANKVVPSPAVRDADLHSSSKSNRNKASVPSSLSNVLSEDSSSDSSDDNSDEGSSSSQSSDEDPKHEPKSSSKPNSTSTIANSRSNVLSMPSFSMPSSFAALSSSVSAPPAAPPATNSAPNSVSATVVSVNNSNSTSVAHSMKDYKKTISILLSEDSDSSDDDRPSSANRAKSSFDAHPKKNDHHLNSSSNTNGSTLTTTIEQIVPSTNGAISANNKPFLDSMPKFTNGAITTAPLAPAVTASTAPSFSSMPKYSQLSQDLQLSESGSDSDDSDV